MIGFFGRFAVKLIGDAGLLGMRIWEGFVCFVDGFVFVIGPEVG
jgi:hypothetical protein